MTIAQQSVKGSYFRNLAALLIFVYTTLYISYCLQHKGIAQYSQNDAISYVDIVVFPLILIRLKIEVFVGFFLPIVIIIHNFK